MKSNIEKSQAAQLFGDNLWEETNVLTKDEEGNESSAECANTRAKAIKADADIKKLAGPAMYHQNGKFGAQIVLKFGDGTWQYAGIARNAKGEHVFSTDNEYRIVEVKAKRTFKVPNSEAVIQPGFMTIKAYAV